MRTIMLQCNRKDSNYAQLAATGDAILITWYSIKRGRHEMVGGEALLFSEHPEMATIHDGKGWNISEVQALILDAYCQEC